MFAKRKTKDFAIPAALAAVALAGALLVGCASSAPKSTAAETGEAKTSEGAGAQIDMTQWSIESDCTACHSVEAESTADPSCAASAHSGMPCADCHADSQGLTEVHQAAKSSTPGKIKRLESPIENELCFTCHGSYEALAEKTADGTVLTDKTGTVVNPHAIPANGEHNEEPACKNCHKMHGDSDPQEYCRSCHHADVYECGTCHE